MKNIILSMCLILFALMTISGQQEKGMVGINNWLNNWTEFNTHKIDYGEVTQIIAGLKDTCRTVAAIVKDMASNPLPILAKRSTCMLAVPVFTDASGDVNGNASLGILCERYRKVKPMVASLRLPSEFLFSFDMHGRTIYHKSTLLEATGPLATLPLQPDRFIGQSAVFIQDSQAAVLALNKRRSECDELATTIVKACRTVAAYLDCSISASWAPRRSDR